MVNNEAPPVIDDELDVRVLNRTIRELLQRVTTIEERLTQRNNQEVPNPNDRIVLGGNNNRNARRVEAPNARELFAKPKIEIPQFDGKTNPDGYCDWEAKVNLIFDKYPCDNGRDQVNLVTSAFSDYALNWWTHFISRTRDRVHRVDSWDAMKEIMQDRFLPPNYKRDLRTRLRKLRQGSKSVEDYFKEMENLMFRAGIEEDAEETITRFTGGLNTYILDKLDFMTYESLNQARHLAITIENQLTRRWQSHSSDSYNKGNPQTKSTSITSKSSFDSHRNSTKETKPSSSGKDRGKQVVAESPTFKVKCFSCGGSGHLKRNCPNNREILYNHDVTDDDLLGSETEPIDSDDDSDNDATPIGSPVTLVV